MSEQTAVREDLTIPDGTNRKTRVTKKRKSRSIHVYLKPGMREDDLLLAVWDATSRGGRPQDGYRRLLLEGVKRMVENGDMPLSIMKDPDVVRYLDVLGDIERDRRHVVVLAQSHFQGNGQPGVLPGQSGMTPHPEYRQAPSALAPAPPAALAPKDSTKPPAKDSSQGMKRRGLDPELM
jgi:hypothetical protein